MNKLELFNEAITFIDDDLILSNIEAMNIRHEINLSYITAASVLLIAVAIVPSALLMNKINNETPIIPPVSDTERVPYYYPPYDRPDYENMIKTEPYSDLLPKVPEHFIQYYSYHVFPDPPLFTAEGWDVRFVDNSNGMFTRDALKTDDPKKEREIDRTVTHSGNDIIRYLIRDRTGSDEMNDKSDIKSYDFRYEPVIYVPIFELTEEEANEYETKFNRIEHACFMSEDIDMDVIKARYHKNILNEADINNYFKIAVYFSEYDKVLYIEYKGTGLSEEEIFDLIKSVKAFN